VGPRRLAIVVNQSLGEIRRVCVEETHLNLGIMSAEDTGRTLSFLRNLYRYNFEANTDYRFDRALDAWRSGLITFSELHHKHLTRNDWDRQLKDMGRLYNWTPNYVPTYFNRYSQVHSAYRPIYMPKFV
jgi:hypothetical protein